MGEILDGPVYVDDSNGNPVTWWRVQFEGQAPLPPGEGWVNQSRLTLADETLMSKEAQACLPAAFNQNVGGSEPTLADLQAFCEEDVDDAAQAAVNDLQTGAGRYLCQCSGQSVDFSSNYDRSCDAPCPDVSGVCLVAGTDPPDPIPEPISASLFQPTSVCEVGGSVEILMEGRAPKHQPTAWGALQIRGRPCTPGEECLLGMSYQLRGDDIEFDSGTIFADDPKFVDLSLSGATEPEAINMGLFLGFYLGEVPPGTAFTSGHGRRSGSTTGFGVSGKNTEGLALAMNWESKTCRVSGQLVGEAAQDDNGEDLDAQAAVALDGIIVNQPPRPDAGLDRTVECTSPDGADVTLDAAGSTDADNNIALYEWRTGSEDGPQITAPSMNPVVQTHQTIGDQTYYLLVADSRFAADTDSVGISVADTTPPDITQVTASPDQLWPPNHKMVGVSLDVTAFDLCGTAHCELTEVTSNEPVNGKGDGNTAPDWQITGDLTANLRAERSGNGNGREYVLTVQCTDSFGNSSEGTVSVIVPH
jgi:hypothetical protein